MDKLSLEEFIYQVKRELLEAQKQHEGEQAYLKLQRVELEVSIAANRTGSGKVNIYVAELGAEVAKELTHVVKLAFDVVPYSAQASSGDKAKNAATSKSKKGKDKPVGGGYVGPGKKLYQ